MVGDCRDADCPLVELSLSSLHLKQRQDGSGCLTSRLSTAYYNREQSAWEPCMEPWGCTVDRISTQLSSKTQRNAVTIKSDEVVNLTLLELFRVVRANWGEDYYSQGEAELGGDSSSRQANTLELHTSYPSSNTKTATYRFCVAVRRLGYPQEAMAIGPGSKAWVQPAHSITFLPPVTLLNLLPCQLEYKVQDTELRGAVRPGAETPLLIDISTIYVLDFFLEAFPGLGSLIM